MWFTFISILIKVCYPTILTKEKFIAIEQEVFAADGFFDYANDRLIIIFRNANTGYVNVAFSDDYGSAWDLSITNIVNASRAPSIAPRF